MENNYNITAVIPAFSDIKIVKEVKEYCNTLEFDGANHEIHAPYVKAWENRHKIK